ncbi:hypothetical protein GCM10020331_034490 [Ectobacillus funiculus]
MYLDCSLDNMVEICTTKENQGNFIVWVSVNAASWIFLDDIGVNCNLWSYPYKLTSVVPKLVAIDYGIIIIAHMSVYQHFKRWKSFFLIANVIMATIFFLYM